MIKGDDKMDKSTKNIKYTTHTYQLSVSAIYPYIEVVGEYVNNKTKILHRCLIDNNLWPASPNNILMGHGCPRCKVTKFLLDRTKSHSQYVNELVTKNPDVEVIGQYKNSSTPIAHKCKRCGYGENGEWTPSPNNLLRGVKCPVCLGKAIGPPPNYQNSIWASQHRQYFARYMTEEQMKQCMPHSNKKVEMVCPDCGETNYVQPNNVLSEGFSCICGDGFSYPNKFIYSFIKQCPMHNIMREWSPIWLVVDGKQRRFDIYFEFHSEKYVIEADGDLGHGNRTYKSRKSDVDGKRIDEQKDVRAVRHNVKVIRIDCRRSDGLYIQNSIKNSILKDIFDLTLINWVQCDEFSQKNIVKVVCDYYKTHPEMSTSDIAKVFDIGRATVLRYLKSGTKIGWCLYDVIDGRNKTYAKTRGINNRSVRAVFCVEEGVIYGSIMSAVRKFANKGVRLCGSNVSACCMGKHKTVGGYHWYYLYDYTKEDRVVILGSISLGLISNDDAQNQLSKQKDLGW